MTKRLDGFRTRRNGVPDNRRHRGFLPLKNFLLLLACTLSLFANGASPWLPSVQAAPTRVRPTPPGQNPAPTPPRNGALPTVMLGIDVLESTGFAAVKGKRIGLLTHAAGVNRRGVSTIDVLRRAPGVKLVALYAVEHGLYGEQVAEESFENTTDPRSGLPVYSLYNGRQKKFRPTPQQLRKIDALVIDLQDVGTRSYTYVGAMKTAMEACFENGKEVIVLDRPNPLGGLKVDGPPLDADWMSDVGRFRVPYVHGLTIGELARMAVALPAPEGISVTPAKRKRGKLTVVPMRGWRRSMRWPETGLTFVPTSQKIQDMAAVMGYAMVGLGCEYSGFVHGIGPLHPFRVIYFRDQAIDRLEKDLRRLRLPGLSFRRVSGIDARGERVTGLYIDVTDWEKWNPTELSFHLMRLACRYNPPNPFATLTPAQVRSFNIHVGSSAWLKALQRDGAKVDVEGYQRTWRQQAKTHQDQSRKYWLYP